MRDKTQPGPDPNELPEPTPAELEVIVVLWRAGQLSAREIHDRLPESLGWAYTTTRTTLDRMARKGLVDRCSFHGLYLFGTRLSRPRGLAALIRRFAEHVLALPPTQVVSLFAESADFSEAELRELEEILQENHP